MTYYEKMKNRRIQLGLTQRDVAEYLGITQQAYAKYENGKNNFDFQTALTIGEKLEISLDDLGLDYRKMKCNPIENLPDFTDSEISTVNKYRTLDNHGKKIVDTVLDLEYERCSESKIFRAASSEDNHPSEILTTTKDFSKFPETQNSKL